LAGTKTYREGLALIEKAKEKLSETRDRIDGLRLIRSDLNASEERAILNQNRKTALEGTRFMFAGLEKLTDRSQARIEADTNAFLAAETARRLADRQHNTEVMRQREESARAVLRDTGETTRANLNARTQTGIAAANRELQLEIAKIPGAQERLFSALGNGKIKEGFDYWSAATAENKGDAALQLAFAKDPLLLEALKTSNPAVYAAYMARILPDTGFKLRGSSPPPTN